MKKFGLDLGRLGCLPVLALLVIGAAVLFGNLAFAQTSAAPTFDLAAWFVDTAALAVVIAGVVAFIREHILKTLEGFGVVLTSLAVGAVFGVGGHVLGYLTGGLVPSLVFGVTAGLAASGGWDALAGLLGKRKAKEPPAGLEE